MRFLRGADASAVEDEQVRYSHPFFFGDELHQVCFYLVGVIFFGESESLGKAAYVGVDCYAFDDAVCVLEDDVGGFSCHAREFEKFGHGSWDSRTVFSDEHFAAVLDIFGFVMIEAAGFYVLFEFI